MLLPSREDVGAHFRDRDGVDADVDVERTGADGDEDEDFLKDFPDETSVSRGTFHPRVRATQTSVPSRIWSCSICGSRRWLR